MGYDKKLVCLNMCVVLGFFRAQMSESKVLNWIINEPLRTKKQTNLTPFWAIYYIIKDVYPKMSVQPHLHRSSLIAVRNNIPDLEADNDLE